MKLAALTEGLQYTLLQGTMEKDVNSLIYFSEEAEAGSAFFAIPGSEKNGLAYVQAAQEKGAEVFLVQESLFLDSTESPQNPQSRPQRTQKKPVPLSIATGKDFWLFWALAFCWRFS